MRDSEDVLDDSFESYAVTKPLTWSEPSDLTLLRILHLPASVVIAGYRLSCTEYSVGISETRIQLLLDLKLGSKQ